MSYDIAVVGAGILAPARPLAAARLGDRVVTPERDARRVVAPIRDSGVVSVTGREAGDRRTKARRSRDVRADIAPDAGIPALNEGLFVTARRAEAARHTLVDAQTSTALRSAPEPRIEGRDAIPRLASWLETDTFRGPLHAEAVILRPADRHAVTDRRCRTSAFASDRRRIASTASAVGEETVAELSEQPREAG